MVAAFLSIIAFASSWFIRELPMGTTVTAEDMGGHFGAPRPPDSLAEILRPLSVLVGRQRMRDWLQRVATESGVDLPLADCWVLAQLRRNPGAELRTLAAVQKVPTRALETAIDDVTSRGLVARRPEQAPDASNLGGGNSTGPVLALTPAGEAVADQLIGAVRAHLEQLLEGWSPEHFPELVTLLGQFATDIVPGAPAIAGRGPGWLEG